MRPVEKKMRGIQAGAIVHKLALFPWLSGGIVSADTATERSSSTSDMADEKPKVRDGTCLLTIFRLAVLYDI